VGFICGNCFHECLDANGICAHCGFDSAKNMEKFPLALPAGSILYGRYIIGKVLGQGGFGITYLAQDYQTKELVAIKEFFPGSMATRSGTTIIPFSGMQGENFEYGRRTFLDEAKTMAQFNGNPNVAGVQMYFEENGTAYFVMEYLDGCTFGDYIGSRGGRLNWEDTAKAMFPILEVLGQIHEQGIVHRDVSPDNIYITNSGTVKLLDFGAARHSLGNVSQSLDMVIKHGFAPKEQYSRRGRQGPYTDVYAASATIYYALTGVKPDESIDRAEEDTMPPPSILGAKVSEQLEAVIMKGLAVDAKDRYQSAAELHQALKSGGKECKKSKSVSEKTLPSKRLTLPNWLLPTAIVVFVVITGLRIVDSAFLKKESRDVEETQIHAALADTETEKKTEPEDPDEVSHIEMNQLPKPVMAKQRAHLYDNDKFWGTTYLNSSVKSVTFMDTQDSAPANAYDVSAARDRSVICWMDGSDLFVAGNGKIIANPDASYLFCNFDYLEEINFNNCFDTSEVTDMSEMFCYCTNIKKLDLSSFVTSGVTDMSNMFQGCYITDLDISGFDTSNVTNMEGMFSGTYITDLDVTGFDTSKVENMEEMFYNCHTRELDLSNFDTSNVTNMMGMFQHCYVCDFDISGLDTSRVTTMEAMFSYFMEEEDITFGMLTKTNFDRSFLNNSNVKRLDLSGFDTSNVKNMAQMFFGCNLSEFDLSSFNTFNVTDMYSMFEWCQGLTNLDLHNFTTISVENMARMFLGCTNLRKLNIPGFVTGAVSTSQYTSYFGSSARYGNGVDNMFDLCNYLQITDCSSDMILEAYRNRKMN